MTELESNKRLVERLFDVIYGTGDNLHTIDEVVAADYVQHNPLAGQGARIFASSLNNSSHCRTGSTRGAPWRCTSSRRVNSSSGRRYELTACSSTSSGYATGCYESTGMPSGPSPILNGSRDSEARHGLPDLLQGGRESVGYLSGLAIRRHCRWRASGTLRERRARTVPG